MKVILRRKSTTRPYGISSVDLLQDIYDAFIAKTMVKPQNQSVFMEELSDGKILSEHISFNQEMIQ